jgi:GAF domain-containing protein
VLAVLTVIATAALSNRWVYWGVNLIFLIRSLHVIFVVGSTPFLERITKAETMRSVFILVGLAVVSLATRFFIQAANQVAGAARRSSSLLQAVSDIEQSTSGLLDLDKLFSQAVEQIRDRFAFYHVQIFIVDKNVEYANLVASTGEVGQRLLAREHRLAVGSQSVIGRVTQIGEPIISSDTDAGHTKNELLPETRSELALPILDGDQIIGALDVQSTRRNAFDANDVRALQVLANHLGTAIRNARLFEAQANSLQENKRLFQESEANLREIQRLNQQLTKVAWDDYMKQQQVITGTTLEDTTITPSAVWTDLMTEARQKRRPVHGAGPTQGVIAVPIMVKGEVLGAIEIELGSNTQETDTIEIVQAIADRLAASLERARLFEDVQETSSLQRHINEIVGRYQSVNVVDDLLQITLTELSETLGATQASIRLTPAHKQEAQNGGSAQ